MTFGGMKLYTHSGTIDGLVDKRLPNDHDHDLSDMIIDCLSWKRSTDRPRLGWT